MYVILLVQLEELFVHIMRMYQIDTIKVRRLKSHYLERKTKHELTHCAPVTSHAS